MKRRKLCVIPAGITNTTRSPSEITYTKLFKPGLAPGLNNFESRGIEPVRAGAAVIGAGARFFLPPKNLENVATFSKFLCPPHLLG